VAEFTNDTTSVKPQSQQDIQTEWATTTGQAGDYTGQVTVSLGDKILATQDLSFKILPPGTFTKQGELTSLNYEGQPLLNTTLKIKAGFQNTGEGDALAKFIGEVYLGGNLIDTINSEDTLVPVGQTGTIISYLKLSQTGDYTIKGYISYYGKQTGTKELDIKVITNNAPTSVTTVSGSQVPASITEKPGGTGKVTLYYIVGGAAAIGILAGILIILRNSRKHAREKLL